MKKDSIKIFVVILVLALVTVWLTSCSGSDELQNGGASAEKTLTLKINTGKAIGSRATNLTKDDSNMTTNESNISRLTIGIFDRTGNVLRTIQEVSGSGITKGSDGKVTAKVVSSTIQTGDKVLVAVNAPTDAFGSATTEAKFQTVSIGAEAALTNGSDKTKEDNSDIPMYGSSTLAGADGNLTATVEVKHLLAKVTLASLTTKFEGSYAGASFTPTGMFLINVPNALAFSDDAWVATNSSWLHGVSDDSEHGTYAEYLTAGTLAGTELKATTTSSLHPVLYTMPNSDAAVHKSKLVIVGTFKMDATKTEDAGETVYYPCPLNATYDEDGKATAGNGDLYKVYPNKNYNCTVSIRGKGAKTPWEDLSPKSAEITVTVKAWDEVNQTTIFK